jgi:hypothetical protein
MDLKSQSFNVYPHQNSFVSTKDKFPALVAGYGAGKTYSFCLKALAELGRNPTKTILLAEPTYTMIRDVLQPTLEEIMETIGFRYSYSAGAMTYIVRWKSGYGKIIMRSAENWRRWAGLNLAGFGIDEAGSLKDDGAWRMGISRLRDGHHLTGWTTTTPEGFNWHYTYWKERPRNGYRLIHAKSTDNKHLPQEFIDSLYDNYDEKLILAYLEGQYVNLQHGQTYYMFDRDNNLDDKIQYNPNLPIRVAIDFNIDPLCAVLFQLYDEKPKVRVFDEFKLHYAGGQDLMTQRMASAIKEKYKNKRDFFCYPDPAGQAHSTKSQFTDHDILRRAGFYLRFKRQAPSITDSVNAVNNAMKTTKINPKCVGIIKDLEQVCNKDNTRQIDKTNKNLTHFSDAFRYAIDYEMPVRRPVTTTIIS